MTATFCAASPSCFTLLPAMPIPLPQSATARANFSLRHGGLGLRSAAEHAPAAYFASWADSLVALRVREPDSCHIVARLLDDATSGPSLPRCLSSLAGAVHLLRDTGFQPPAFADLPLQPPARLANPDEPVDTSRSWQRPASRAIDDSTAGRFRAMLDPPSLALLESECGPFASRVLTASPSCHELTLDSPVFRALLLRRLRCPCLSTKQLVAAAVLSTLSVTTALLAPVLASCAPSRACCCPCLPRGWGYDLDIHPERLDDRRIEAFAHVYSAFLLIALLRPPCTALSMDPQLQHIERDIGDWHVAVITLLLMAVQPDIGNNIDFVADVCIAAEACEMCADDRGVDRELGAVPQRQAVGDYFDATCITDKYIDDQSAAYLGVLAGAVQSHLRQAGYDGPDCQSKLALRSLQHLAPLPTHLARPNSKYVAQKRWARKKRQGDDVNIVEEQPGNDFHLSQYTSKGGAGTPMTSCSAGTGPFFECQPGCPSPTHLDPCNAAHRCLAWCRKAFAAPAATLPRQSSDVSHIVAYCAWASSREAMHMSARSSTMPMEAHHQQGRTFVLSPQEAMPHSASTKSTTVTDRRMLAHMQQRPQKSSKNTGKFSDTCTDEAALSRARKKCRGQGINLLVAFALSDAADIGITKLITAHRNRMKRDSPPGDDFNKTGWRSGARSTNGSALAAFKSEVCIG
ncbi:hypothetical protein AK812_SmicGene20564 [Symbiodinium microadriaticum]|uniref:Uncharacterized protein n=1 Tax=Symbiodinium microadriaticum TaxID=2951 RepID=A0A1Q9DPN3_SYMMI|nr:hypothetical protein AK812_SmicGene20564 [Symbiodinium microadriaticum]